jgi:hypothetical protein
MSPSLRSYTRNALSRKDLEVNLREGFHNIVASIYGDWNKEIVDAAHMRGVQRVQMQMAEADAQSALRAAGGGGRATGGMRAVGAAGRLADRSQNQLRPAPSASPAAVERAMETAAAAMTAPITPAAPAAVVAGGALQSLLALGISPEDAQWIMSLPPAQRIGAMRVAMGN